MRKLIATGLFVGLTAVSLGGCRHSSDVPAPDNLGNVTVEGITYPPGPKPPQFYADATKNKVVSKLSFDDIATRVKFIQDRTGLPATAPAVPVHAYVFFDPLCMHCATLVKKLLSQEGVADLKYIAWVPIGFLKPYSSLQGATLLSAPSPSLALFQHELLVSEGKGKEYALNVRLATQPNIDAVVANTKVWQAAGANQTPFIVTKDAYQKTLAVYGTLEAFEMAEFMSLVQLPKQIVQHRQ